MKIQLRRKNTLILAVTLLLGLAACANSPDYGDPSTGQIFLYGEQHGVAAIFDKEFEIWREYYQNDGMRHLFIEYPYYTAEYLNMWMRDGGDEILDAVYADLDGTAAHVPAMKDFFMRIKDECPKTVFHGTDVGHQYETTGKRFLETLSETDERYVLTQEAIDQGREYYERADAVYRENKMTDNFIRHFDLLDGEDVMGIYGTAHTGLDAKDTTGNVPCMANRLKERYGVQARSEDLSWIRDGVEPSRTDEIEVNEKRYEALYFGQQDLAGFNDYAYREFWRLEDAFDDFKDRPKTGDVLPYNNYPMPIETGQVFVIDYTSTDGNVTRTYYRSDGDRWQGSPATVQFTV